MAIWIRTVDPQWFDYVSSRRDLTEINLWVPAGRRILDGAETGDLVLFRVRGRLGLAGCGLFFNTAIYFAADAWQLFGPGNGAPTSEAFRASVLARHPARRSTFFPLGCHDIVEPVSFEKHKGRLPEEAIRRLAGGPIDEDSPDGLLLLAFIEEAQSPARSAAEGSASSPLERAKRRQVSPGRAGFQIALHNAYDRTCAITGVTVLPTLEAAHFIADRYGGPMDVRNGILLRRDFHPLLEQGYMGVSNDYTVLFSKWLPRAYPHCEGYLRFNRKRLLLPKNRNLWPALPILEQHRTTTFFKGGTFDG